MIEKLKEQHKTELTSLQMSLNRMIMVLNFFSLIYNSVPFQVKKFFHHLVREKAS